MGRMSALITSRPPMLAPPREKPQPHQTTTCPETLKSQAQAEAQKQKAFFEAAAQGEPRQNGGQRHDIEATINYWKDPGDGSLPTPINVSEYVTFLVPRPPTLRKSVHSVSGAPAHPPPPSITYAP